MTCVYDDTSRMLAIGKAFDYTHFNSLPHIHDVSHVNVEAEVLQLGNLIIEMDMQKYLGVHRIHKHFDISSEEQVRW